MLPARRSRLADVEWTEAQHAGLWLDRFLKQQLPKGQTVATDEETPQKTLVDEVSGIAVGDAYRTFYRRWLETVDKLADVGKPVEVSMAGRMAIGLGDESVIETGITLHHTYGVPYIPGSALKGMAAAYARQRLEEPAWRKDGDAYQIVFGTTDEAGFVTFYDALYVPTEQKNRPLQPDVLTVHHKDYYEGKGAPADWDSPTPVSFLSSTGSFLIVIGCPFKEWGKSALEIVQMALADVGVGAKTSSGYGRSAGYDNYGSESEPAAQPARETAVVRSFRIRLEAMATGQVAGQIHAVYKNWRTVDNETARKEIACLILKKIREAGREKASRKKDWFKEIRNAAGNDCL